MPALEVAVVVEVVLFSSNSTSGSISSSGTSNSLCALRGASSLCTVMSLRLCLSAAAIVDIVSIAAVS